MNQTVLRHKCNFYISLSTKKKTLHRAVQLQLSQRDCAAL